MTSRDPIRDHLSYLRRRNCQPGTITQRHEHLRRLQTRLDAPLLDADPLALEGWQKSLVVCASSVQTYSSHVRAFYRWAHDTRLITEDPSRELVMPRIKRRMPRPIPEAELEAALVTARPSGQLFCWFLLAGYCGLRAAEISKVRRTDLHSETRGKGGYLRVHGKGGHERVVRVSPEVMNELSRYLHQSGPIFRRPSGVPVTPHDVSRTASVHLAGIGLPYTLHQLRHRFATRLCDLGADVRDVQDALGHTSLATTSVYLKSNGGRSAKVVDRLAKEIRE